MLGEAANPIHPDAVGIGKARKVVNQKEKPMEGAGRRKGGSFAGGFQSEIKFCTTIKKKGVRQPVTQGTTRGNAPKNTGWRQKREGGQELGRKKLNCQKKKSQKNPTKGPTAPKCQGLNRGSGREKLGKALQNQRERKGERERNGSENRSRQNEKGN